MLVMYWLDKTNFLKHMKKPPRYGVELSEMTRKLFQYALLVHLLFAFFMFSNTHIFNDETPKGKDKKRVGITFFESVFQGSGRMRQTHSQIYFAFLILFSIIFFLYKLGEYLYETVEEVQKTNT